MNLQISISVYKRMLTRKVGGDITWSVISCTKFNMSYLSFRWNQ